MNILAEKWQRIRVGQSGIVHTMLPRGCCYATYLPQLCIAYINRERISGRSLSWRRKVISILISGKEVTYMCSRGDAYLDDVTHMSRDGFSAFLQNSEVFHKNCANAIILFDAHDLLENKQCDMMVKALCHLEMLSEKCGDSDGTFPYILITHTASNSAVTYRHSYLQNRSMDPMIPPRRGKVNIVVQHIDTFDDCIAYISSIINKRLSKNPSPYTLVDRGDYLIMTRSETDAVSMYMQVSANLPGTAYGLQGTLGYSIKLHMVGPVSTALVSDHKMARSGMVLSQTLESFVSDKCPSYGIVGNLGTECSDKCNPPTLSNHAGNCSSRQRLCDMMSATVSLSQNISSGTTASSRIRQGYPMEGNDMDTDLRKSHFDVYFTWADWSYYSMEVWKVSSIFKCLKSNTLEDMNVSDREDAFAKLSANAVGSRKECLKLYTLGM